MAKKKQVNYWWSGPTRPKQPIPRMHHPSEEAEPPKPVEEQRASKDPAVRRFDRLRAAIGYRIARRFGQS